MTQAEFAEKFGVSRETLERLAIHEALLQKWNPRINLVAPRSLPDLWHRHFVDSAQLLELAPEGNGTWADLGAGGGFPGAVLAILDSGRGGNRHFKLVESDQRKAAFLRALTRETGIAFDVSDERIEALAPLDAAVVSARALAPLPRLLEFVARHLAPGGIALLPKGARVEEELAEARETWSFRLEQAASVSDPAGTILKIGDIQRV